MLKVSRLDGLTDGIFAIAMTILVLDLHLPAAIPSTQLAQVLMTSVMLKLFVYIGSFIILGTQWIAMNFQQGLLAKLNRPYLWMNIFYLMCICVVPFSASLVAAYPDNPVSITFYSVNLLFAMLGQFMAASVAHVYQLNREIYSDEIRTAIHGRIFVSPIFYISAIFLAYWNTTIAFIALIAPILIYIIPGKVDKFEDAQR